MGLRADPDAFKVTVDEAGNRALQTDLAEPDVRLQEMPAGAECTHPVPPAPLCTVRTNSVGGGAKAAVMARSAFIRTLQERGSSV
jgi:hypothetical protein